MNKQQLLLYSLLSGALLFGMSEAAFAAELAAEEYTLDEYVVTANRVPTKVTETAAAVTVITRAEIEKGGFTSVPEILKSTSVTIEDDSTGALPVVNGDHRVLILVDGRRMNWDQIVKSGSSGGVNLSYLPIKNIERIEIVRGPGSSLYGSDAVGGVINIITRQATEANTLFSTEAGSWGLRNYSLVTESKLDNGFSYFLAAEHKKQGDYDYIDAETGKITSFAATHFDQNTVNLRLDKELDSDRSLSLQVDHMDRDGGFNWSAKGYYYTPEGRSNALDNNVALTYRQGQNNFLRIFRNYSTENAHSNLTDYRVSRSALGGEWQQSVKLNDNNTLVGGTEWIGTDFDYPTQGIDKNYNTHAFYIEDHIKLPSNWTVTMGTRYDDHSIIGDHVTSRFTANRKLSDTTNIFASWGQFVKAPTIEALYTTTAFMIGNPNLKPETGDTITVGMNTQLGEGTKLQTSVFSSRITDALSWESGATINDPGRYINLAQEKRQGLDITLTRQLSPQWNVSAGYSYVNIKSKADATSDYFADNSNSQPRGYRLNVQYDQDKWDAGLTLRSAAGRSLTHFTSQSYATLDMVLNYQATPDTRIYVKGYNLTNDAYELRGYNWPIGAYPMPARHFLFGIEKHI